MRTRRQPQVILVMALLTVTSPSAWAQDPLHKGGRGAVNVLTGWIEIPKNFQLGLQEENPVLGAAWGLIKGTGLALTRMGFGAYEALTFPIPIPAGYASPYEGLELPDFPWE